MTADDLHGLTLMAIAAAQEPEGAAVLSDRIIEAGWIDTRVMMLCLGVPLETRPPEHLGERGRQSWSIQRKKSIDFANSQWELYVGSARADFVRAVLATLLFGDWPKSSPLRNGSRSPFALVKAQMRQRAEDEQAARRHFRDARAVRDNALRAIRREAAWTKTAEKFGAQSKRTSESNSKEQTNG